MFTGLIEGTGTLIRMDRHGPDAKLVIQADYALADLALGESIAVDGACLTVVRSQGNVFTADVSVETLGRTTLGRKSPGSRFNLERALRVGDRLGGHIVTGHVDGVGNLTERYTEGRSWRLVFRAPHELTAHIVEKGSIAVNGISLTVNGCQGDLFDVNIVPHTVHATTIGGLTVGAEVNLETDVIGKYVEKMVRTWTASELSGKSAKTSTIDNAFLRKHGFTD